MSEEKEEVKAATEVNEAVNESPVEETETVDEQAVDEVNEAEEERELSPKEKLEAELQEVINERAGFFPVPNLSHEDIKWILNWFKSKIEWRGGNEAFLVTTTRLALEQAHQAFDPKSFNEEDELPETQLMAATIEAIAYFANRYSGKGEQSARKFFKIVMCLNNATKPFGELDQRKKELEAKINAFNSDGDDTPDEEKSDA
jgi:hypothetical protein